MGGAWVADSNAGVHAPWDIIGKEYTPFTATHGGHPNLGSHAMGEVKMEG